MSVLARSEVIRRLRQREEPIKLFGESDEDAYQRLMKLEVNEQEESHGLTNDFKEAMDKINQDNLVVMNESSSLESATNRVDVNTTDFNVPIEEIKILVKDLNTGPGAKQDETVNAKDCDTILKFFRFLLEKWGKKLNCRPLEEKLSMAGKRESAIYTQTQAYLKPVFKLLRSHRLSLEILRLLKLIVKDMIDKNYVRANEHYLQITIGNAAWPIGVTMVGIHARTGREKISQNNIAHALNDDTQRKYLQGLKRLMTQCQNMYPTDPSRSF